MKKRLFVLLLIVAVLTGAVIAATAATESNVLTADVEDLTVSTNTVLDLNGFSIGTLRVAKGATVTVKDSATDDYTVADGTYGRITTLSGKVKADSGYLMLTEADGTSFHKLTLNTTGVALRANKMDTDGVCMYYTCTFGGDEVIKRNIAAYGVAMGANKAPDFAEKTYTRITDIADSWVVGDTFTDNGTLLKGIMAVGAADADNQRNAAIDVQNKAYVELLDGTRILSSQKVAFTLRAFVEQVTGNGIDGINEVWDCMTGGHKDMLVELRKAFTEVTKNWEMPRLDSYEEDGDVVQLRSAEDLKKLAEKPYKDFFLMNDIDMTGVADYAPVGVFTGSFNGNGNTISNLTISKATGNAMGLFATLYRYAQVTDLHMENIVLELDGTEAKNIGAIAGVNNGQVTGCTVAGVIKDTRSATASNPIYAGAFVGTNNGTLTPATMTVNQTVTDVTGKSVTYTTEDVVARFAFKTADSDHVHTGLVGSGTVDSALLWQDLSNATVYDHAQLQSRRRSVVDYVYESGTIKWTVPSTMTYYNDQAKYSATTKPSGFAGLFGGSFHIHNQKFVKGTTYIGIPYTHCSSSLEQAKFYMTDNGNGTYTVQQEIASIVGGNKKSGNFLTGYTYSQNAGDADWESGNIGWGKYIGSDCSSALTMAWHKVSPILTNNKTNGGVCLYYTSNIVPSQFNQWFYGVRQVGDYVVDDVAMSDGKAISTSTAGGVTMSDYGLTTDEIVAAIGVTAVYDAYAQTKMGDILNSSGTAGHSRMAALDPVVIRTAAGAIDPAKSYFVTHEQGDGLYERTTTNSSWRINYRYTFEQLAYQNIEGLTGSSGYYLPISMDAFHDVSLATSASTHLSGGRKFDADGKSDPSYVVLNSAFRIQCAEMTITDASGAVLYNKTAFQGTHSEQSYRRAVPGRIIMYMDEFFGDYGKNLTPGETYYFTLTGTTFSGNVAQVYSNQAFVYTPAT